MLPEIEYHRHADTAAQVASFVPGLKKEDLPGGEGWAVETLRISTHNGTHLDAPYHHHSTMSGGERALTRPLTFGGLTPGVGRANGSCVSTRGPRAPVLLPWPRLDARGGVDRPDGVPRSRRCALRAHACFFLGQPLATRIEPDPQGRRSAARRPRGIHSRSGVVS